MDSRVFALIVGLVSALGGLATGTYAEDRLSGETPRVVRVLDEETVNLIHKMYRNQLKLCAQDEGVRCE